MIDIHDLASRKSENAHAFGLDQLKIADKLLELAQAIQDGAAFVANATIQASASDDDFSEETLSLRFLSDLPEEDTAFGAAPALRTFSLGQSADAVARERAKPDDRASVHQIDLEIAKLEQRYQAEWAQKDTRPGARVRCHEITGALFALKWAATVNGVAGSGIPPSEV
jgi:hypothetical protein